MSCKICWRTPCCCSSPSGCSLGIDEHGHIHGCNKCHHNPCTCSCNTAVCETLPSQIENFTKQFFGVVTKTEVAGVVTWSLPCDLDTGLENNPRLSNEGLACYFKRLFEQGIVGLTGPEGSSGATGTDGNNAYTVTLSSYAQPTSANPNAQVLTAYNPAIFAGLTIHIQTSGYFFVNDTDGNGTLFLTLIQAADGAPAVITAGKLVVVSGPQGSGPQGTQGVQGAPGPQGTPGDSFTATNGFYSTDTGTNFTPGVVYTQVDFTTSQAQVLLPVQGKYLLTAIVSLLGKGTVLPGDIVEAKIRDTTISIDVEASEQGESNLVDIQRTAMTLHAIYETDSDNHTLGIFAKCTTSGAIEIVAVRTVLSFVRLE